MSGLQQHRRWIGLMAVACIIIGGSGPVAHLMCDKTKQNLAELQAAHIKTEQDLQQLREDVARAQKLSRQIDRLHAEQILAPADRLKAAAALEKLAKDKQLRHFTYTLGPEDKLALNAGGESQELAISTIALTADAPSDQDVFTFLEKARILLPGRARIQHFTINRIAPAALAATNIHFEASLEWLSNGSLQTVAGVP
jgi:hypothetical protein